MIISSLALALAFGGSLTGGAAMTGSDVFLDTLVPPPLKEFYNKAANGTLTNAEVCNAYGTIVEGGSDADGMKMCATTSFVISMVGFMVEQPALQTGLDTSTYTLDCGVADTPQTHALDSPTRPRLPHNTHTHTHTHTTTTTTTTHPRAFAATAAAPPSSRPPRCVHTFHVPHRP